ncbi:hypothetical protein HDZ31DRAFT_84249 [Schizophyllum fasciatum]
MRYPLALLLFTYLLAFVFGRMKAALSPLCILPGISSTPLCYTPPMPPDGARVPQVGNFPEMMHTQNKFEQLLEDTAGGASLSLELKKAEIATRDLTTLVRVSNLKSKESLGTVLVDIVDEAKKTGRGLHRLGIKVIRAVDEVIAANNAALHTIEAAQDRDSSFSFSDLVLWAPKRDVGEIVRVTFTQAMEVQSQAMARLLVELTARLADLDRLEELLDLLHEVVAREDKTLTAEKDELLAQLWTFLGGNRKELREQDDHLALLRALGGYRKEARAQVVGALHTLQSMEAEMEDLRDRVSAPNLAAQAGLDIPVRVHIDSIRDSLVRLKDRRIKAREDEEEGVRRVLESP